MCLLEFRVRQQLQNEGAHLAGLYPGNPKRATARPTAELLLRVFVGSHADGDCASRRDWCVSDPALVGAAAYLAPARTVARDLLALGSPFFKTPAQNERTMSMTSLLKKTFFVLLLGSGILLTASAAFADWHHHHHYRHHHHYSHYSYAHRPYGNRTWYGQRRSYPQYRYSQRSYGPYTKHQSWQRSPRYHD